jgi:murein DD-endopeptidase MepM/ murein hydrolase activator NlpD
MDPTYETMTRTDPADGTHRATLLLTRLLASALALTLVGGCDEVAELREELFDTETPRERYEMRLDRAGLAGTALAVDWREAGARALREAPLVTSPHSEEGYLPPGEPDALSFRLALHRGQEVSFEFALHSDTATLLFIDAWQVVEDSVTTFDHIESADSGSTTLRFEPRRNGDYVIRVQPELLRGGRFSATLRLGPTLAFPVEGGGERDIGSVFGDPRDGGSRSHHGIDIFAPRGTPAVASAAGTAYRVRETAVGGKVVWLRDERGNRLYYAHLDSQVVADGQRVMPGDTVGFIGNTGNARTTPPHLHFGVYSRGPTDPYWFVHQPGGSIPRLTADTARLGVWARTAAAGTLLRRSPTSEADGRRPAELARHTPVRVIAAMGDLYRVRLPDGESGFIGARQLESLDGAIDVAIAAGPTRIRIRPNLLADVLDETAPGDRLAVLGRYGEYLLVRPTEGRDGWISQSQ